MGENERKEEERRGVVAGLLSALCWHRPVPRTVPHLLRALDGISSGVQLNNSTATPCWHLVLCIPTIHG